MSRSTGSRAKPCALLGRLVFVLPLIGAACSGGGSSGGGGNGGGNSGGNPPQNPLALTAVAPASGTLLGGTTVTVTGAGFTSSPAVVVEFGPVSAEDVVVISDTELTCSTPAAAPGMVNVKVHGGGFTAMLPDAFEFVDFGTRADLDGDGFTDLIVGASRTDAPAPDAGSVCVFLGDGTLPVDRLASEADLQILGPVPGAELGHSVASGDVDGDGAADLVIGAPGLDNGWVDDGAVYVFLGPITQTGTLSAAGADLVLFAQTGTTGDYFGNRVMARDVDDDGTDDLIVGALRHDGAGSLTGAIYVFTGGPDITAATTDGALRLTGSLNNERFGADIAVSDVDGDAVADLVVGAPFHDGLRGAAYVYRGPIEVGASPDMTFLGNEGGERFGAEVELGDVDADGTDDLIVGAPGADVPGNSQGAVSVYFGGPGLAGGPASSADVTLTGEEEGDQLGAGLVVGDLDGDGVDDVVAAATHVDLIVSNVGAAYVFFGWAGLSSSSAAAADVTLRGETVTNGNLGSVLQLFDADGDGMSDLCATAMNVGAGKVHVFYGGPGRADASATDDDLTFHGEGSDTQFGCVVVSDR